MLRKVFTVFLLTLLIANHNGCSPKQIIGSDINENKSESYQVASRQLPPEPVYNRLTWVNLPVVYPAAKVSPRNDRPQIFPVFHFSINNKPLCDAAHMLAGTARYSSYCSTLLKNQTVSLSALGTIDEIADKLEEHTQARVVVDHTNREVRLLLNTGVKESFLNSSENEEQDLTEQDAKENHIKSDKELVQ